MFEVVLHHSTIMIAALRSGETLERWKKAHSSSMLENEDGKPSTHCLSTIYSHIHRNEAD